MKICDKHNEEMVPVGKTGRLKCRTCNKEYQAKWYQDNQEIQKSRVKVFNEKIRERNRAFLLEYLLAHPCTDCGEVDPVVLEFDHLRDKEYGISQMISFASINSILEEIDKCEVVCANCHKRRTAKRAGWFKFTAGS